MTSLGSLNDYEEYPARCCWIHPRFRMCEDPPSNSEESPQLSLFELELERRETERKTQEMRPFCQKRVYWCFSLRIWQMILIYSFLLALTICIIGLNVHYAVKLKDKAENLKHVGKELDKKNIELDKKNIELDKKNIELEEIKREIERLGIEVEQKQKEIKDKDMEFQSLAEEKQKSDILYKNLSHMIHYISLDEEQKQQIRSMVKRKLKEADAADSTLEADHDFISMCNVVLFSMALKQDIEQLSELYTLMLWTGSIDFITLQHMLDNFHVFPFGQNALSRPFSRRVFEYLEEILDEHNFKLPANMNEQLKRVLLRMAFCYWMNRNIESSTKLLENMKNQGWVDSLDWPYLENLSDELAESENEEEKEFFKQFLEFVKNHIFTTI